MREQTYFEKETLGCGVVKVSTKQIESNSGQFGLMADGKIVLLTACPHYLTREDLATIQEFLDKVDAEDQEKQSK